MTDTQRIIAALLGVFVFLLAWAASVAGCLAWAMQPGQGGAVLMALFALLLGYTFFQEIRENLQGWVG